MSDAQTTTPETGSEFSAGDYKYGFTTPVEMEEFTRGLSEQTIRDLSAKKGEPAFLLEFRLKAYRKWLTMKEPEWAHVDYPPVDYQSIAYFVKPKQKPQLSTPKSSRPSSVSASRWTSRRSSPTWPWTPCSTPSAWPPRTRRNCWSTG
jgi:hypothetical protein